MGKRKIAKRHLCEHTVLQCLHSRVQNFTADLLKKKGSQILRYFYNSSLHIYKVETNVNGCKNTFTTWGYVVEIDDYKGYAFYHIKNGKVSIFAKEEVKIIEEIFGSFFMGKRFLMMCHGHKGIYYQEC